MSNALRLAIAAVQGVRSADGLDVLEATIRCRRSELAGSTTVEIKGALDDEPVYPGYGYVIKDCPTADPDVVRMTWHPTEDDVVRVLRAMASWDPDGNAVYESPTVLEATLPGEAPHRRRYEAAPCSEYLSRSRRYRHCWQEDPGTELA